jgi:two-component system, NtrC family, sensor histidine kinase PilS
VLDDVDGIRMANPAAQRLLNLTKPLTRLDQAGPAFRSAYRDWADLGREATSALTSEDGQHVQLRFARLAQPDATLSMVILEDHDLHQQRVQQSKLKSLGQLTASIAHEIRNPLSAILQAAQLLGEAAGLQDEDRSLVRIIVKHTQRVNEIVENVTQISRRRSSQRECIVLGPWLKRFLTDFAEEHRLEPDLFKLSGGAPGLEALVDPSQLKQILENLCSNALKYGQPEKAALEVVLGRDERDRRPFIDVIDHGAAIEQPVADRIFEPFFTTSRSGTGLGLYIARELAELNRARLEYRPLSGGSAFRISMTNAKEGALEL